MLEHILLKTHLKNIYLMAKPGEKKSNFAKTVMDMDQLTMTILKEHNGLNRKSDGLLLKPGKQISEEIHTLNTDSAFCCLPLIADAIIQNMDKRLKDELGLTMFDPKISYAIRGRISFLGIGSVYNPDKSPETLKKEQSALLEKLKQKGLVLQEKENRNGEYSAPYKENADMLNAYFDRLNMTPTYTIRKNIIKDTSVSMAIDEFTVYDSENSKEPVRPTDTLTEQEAFSLQKSIKMFHDVITFSYTKDDQFVPIAGEETATSLMRNCMDQIETILNQPGQISEIQKKLYEKTRTENLEAHALQERLGLQLLMKHKGSLRNAFSELEEKVNDLFAQTGFYCQDVYMTQYGNTHIQIVPGIAFSKISENTMPDKYQSHKYGEIHIPNTSANRDYLLCILQFADKNAKIAESTIDSQNNIKSLHIVLTNFAACQCIKERT